MEFGGSRKLQKVVGNRGGTVRAEFWGDALFTSFLEHF